MKNTERFYKRAQEYQDKRATIQERYERELQELENKQGSSYYEERLKEIESEHKASIASLKKEYSSYFQVILSDMSDTNNARGIKAPTEEELRIIQLLKMKDKLTERELEASAVTLANNDTCLSILTEIAHKQGILRSFMTYSKNEAPAVESVNGILKELRASVNDFMDYDTTKISRAVENYNTSHYGTNVSTNLVKRAQFSDIEGCYKELANMTPKELELFSSVVNA